jgi:chromatin assembly factor 1 subunit B
MKYSNPEISWHNRDPVLSIDFQPQSSDGLLRLATGGSQGNDPSEIHVIVASFSLGLAFFSQLDYNLILFCSY